MNLESGYNICVHLLVPIYYYYVIITVIIVEFLIKDNYLPSILNITISIARRKLYNFAVSTREPVKSILFIFYSNRKIKRTVGHIVDILVLCRFKQISILRLQD